jgi:hypothetical protein
LDGNNNPMPEPKPVDRYTDALVRIRLVTNFSVDPSAKTDAQTQREARTVTTPEGGLVNLELSRYLAGWRKTGFSAFLRLNGGAGLHQITTTTDATTSYQSLFYGGGQATVQVPVVPLAINGTPSSFLLSAEPFFRNLSADLRPLFGNKRSLFGTAWRIIGLLGDKAGVGVTYRSGRPNPPSSIRWSIEGIYLR